MPVCAHCDASRSVIDEIRISGVVAPLLHVLPDPIEPCWFSAQCLPVLVMTAPTAPDLPASEVRCLRCRSVSAITEAFPKDCSVFAGSDSFDDYYFPKPLTD